MEIDVDAATNDVIAMNLTIAALEPWLKDVDSERRGDDLGREIGALYREIHAAVDEMSGPDDEYDDEDEDDEEAEGTGERD
jgi:hypothetical protein